MEGYSVLILLILLQAILFGILSSIVAKAKNLDEATWFVLGLLFSGLAIIALIAIPKKEIFNPDEFKICPDCAENVKTKAKICRYCGHVFELNDVTADEINEDDSVSNEEPPIPTIRCSNCGAEINESEQFCTWCGIKFKEPLFDE